MISLLPGASDALYERVRLGELSEMPILLAAGGIADGRGVAAALTLGAEGVVMGTKYLASEEADILQGYKNDVLRTVDGGTDDHKMQRLRHIARDHGLARAVRWLGW